MGTVAADYGGASCIAHLQGSITLTAKIKRNEYNSMHRLALTTNVH